MTTHEQILELQRALQHLARELAKSFHLDQLARRLQQHQARRQEEQQLQQALHPHDTPE